ncbi:MAG TPA: type II secretion system protein GspG [Thermoanaerobaculia bacterium]|nr:type II secretion system protein GspG [Thermoanaerobaculia bacterium]
MVLVGGLVVIAILGILAAIAIPNLLTAMQRSKQKRSMADIRSAATAVEAWSTDTGHYPEASTMDELEQQLSPKYIAVLPKVDGWGNPIKYACWSVATARCDSYAFGSAARDGVFSQDSLKDYAGGTGTTNFDDDIIYSNGGFIQYPQN